MKSGILKAVLLCASLVLIPALAAAQNPPLVPAEPVHRLVRSLADLAEELDRVRGYDCPDFDPKQARQVGEGLGQIKDLLEIYRWELNRGWGVARRHFDQVAGTLVRQEGKLARIQKLYAWQDFATSVGKLMLDMIDVTSFGNDLFKAILEKENPFAAEAKIEKLRKVIAFANDAEQGIEGVVSQAPAAIKRELDPPESPTKLGTVRQAAQNFIGAANSAILYLQAQKRAAQGLMNAEKLAELRRGLKADVAQLTLGIFQSYAEHLRAEMNERIRELEGIVPREQEAVSAVFRELQRWSAAQDLIDEALRRVNSTRRLFDAATSAYFIGPVMHRVEPQPKFPTSGESLRHLETLLPAKVSALAGAIQNFRLKRPITPQVLLAKTEYQPGEAIEVKFTAPPCLASRAWLGILPADAPHGSAKRNDQRQLNQRFLRKQKEGTLSFAAPKRAGSYEFRMNSDLDGVEMLSVGFTVSREPEGVVLRVPAGALLQASMGDVKSETIKVREK
jgi:hypothetical protein